MSFPVFPAFFLSLALNSARGYRQWAYLCLLASRDECHFFLALFLSPSRDQASVWVLAGSVTSEKPTGAKSLVFSLLGSSSFGSCICQPESIRSFSLFVSLVLPF